LGAQFGPAASDIQTITDWLSQHGFTVNAVLDNKMAIDFSGTAIAGLQLSMIPNSGKPVFG
jgi:hypothetical protein